MDLKKIDMDSKIKKLIVEKEDTIEKLSFLNLNTIMW